MKSVFYAKISTLNEFGHKRIDQEGVYSTFDKAYEFIKTDFFENPSNRELKLYRYDITEIEIDSDNIQAIWEYNCKGMLLNEIRRDRQGQQNQISDFRKGEIVKLKMSDFWQSSNIDVPLLAVISDLPDFNNEEPEFLIEYISNLGFLDHMHIASNEIEKYEKEVPSELEFLQILSDYYKNKIDISEKDFKEIRCNIYLKNIKSYKELKIRNN